MAKFAYYNEFNPFAAGWLRELIKRGLIADGEVDERSIEDVQPADLRGFTRCHFFAGIGGWDYALRLAEWGDKPVWTGSCPCQPLSCAGQRKGHADQRHLWPAFYRLISECRPAIVFGEQVASKDGREWFAGVRADLETVGYACGAADLCAAGVSAPMVSQRLHWLCAATSARSLSGAQRKVLPGEEGARSRNGEPERSGCDGIGMAQARDTERRSISEGRQDVDHRTNTGWQEEASGFAMGSAPGSRMAAPNGYHGHWWSGPLQVGWNCIESEVERSGRKYRAQWRVKPGLSLLADGVPGRVGKLCGFGNAIVPQLAAEFIAAARETLETV